MSGEAGCETPVATWKQLASLPGISLPMETCNHHTWDEKPVKHIFTCHTLNVILKMVLGSLCSKQSGMEETPICRCHLEFSDKCLDFTSIRKHHLPAWGKSVDRQECKMKVSSTDHVWNRLKKEDLECDIQGHSQGQLRKYLPNLQDSWSTLRTIEQWHTHQHRSEFWNRPSKSLVQQMFMKANRNRGHQVSKEATWKQKDIDLGHGETVF